MRLFCKQAINVLHKKRLLLHRLHKIASTQKASSLVKPLFMHASNYTDSIAIDDVHGEHSYLSILNRSRQLSNELYRHFKIDSVSPYQCRIAVLCPNDIQFVISNWAVWMLGHVFVPLNKHSPASQLEYFIKDSESSLVIASPCLAEKVRPMVDESKLCVLDSKYLSPKVDEPIQADYEMPDVNYYSNKANLGLIIYTSGTTGNPKGVMLSYFNVQSHIECLLKSWGWTRNDYILHSLPLHHVHGITNALLCPLTVGARCLLLPKFNVADVWNELISTKSNKVNIMMGVPTMYKMLIDYYDKSLSDSLRLKEFVKSICTQTVRSALIIGHSEISNPNFLRLMVSGSAPLPDPIFLRWQEITGHQLLERYGMTEIGMSLSMPLNAKRQPGFVGAPLPNVHVRISKKDPKQTYKTLVEGNQHGSHILEPSNVTGELLVKGPNVFNGYYNRESETKTAFTQDGWFITGDTVTIINGWYKILGRSSVDIIKTGGYKVSALDVEKHILGHPKISDVAIVGLPDITWGEKIVAVAVLHSNMQLELKELAKWCETYLPTYSIPSSLKVVQELPRNHMGKLNKKELKQLLTAKLI